MQPRIGTLLGLLGVLVLLVYYTVRLEKYDDPRLYYEVAGQALGRPADEAYLRMKRDNTPLTAPLAVSSVPAGHRRLPYRDFAVEYPPLALGVFVLPRLLTDNADRYMHIMQAMMGGAILVTTFVLARMLRRLRPEVQDPTRLALLLTALTVGLAGSYMVRRFDVLLSATIAVSMLSMIAGSPFTAGLFLGAGRGDETLACDAAAAAADVRSAPWGVLAAGA